MGNKEKPSKRGVKIASSLRETQEVSVTVEINGYLYSSYGSSKLDSMVDAIEAHVFEDREFKSDISLISKGENNEIVYAPAVLCMLGYISKGDLYSLLVGDTLEDVQDGNVEE